jgi:tetratricopeptide (TPR) repeat protein
MRSMTTMSRNNRAGENLKVALAICVCLAVFTWLVFGQTLGHEFINFDDPNYVYENPEVTRGLTLHGMTWAFTHSHSGNWHPLTTITHMLDCQLYGLNAGGHHCTNVVLHMLVVVLLFLVLREMTGGPSSPRDESVSRKLSGPDRTGSVWRSAFVAALFAIHPLHVESVAWVAERKDVLSGVFFMLTLAAYLRYVRQPSWGRYLLVVSVFALGLMSKPMMVTVPFVLLLLDYWPLERGQWIKERSKRPTLNAQRSTSNEEQKSEGSLPRRSLATAGRRWEGRSGIQNLTYLVLEKIPLLVLSAISCGITLLVQKGALASIENTPLWLRIYNALVSCVTYIWQMFWPERLALEYPYPSGALSLWVVMFAIAVLFAITNRAWALRKQRPYLIIGWLWYLGMLVPVNGIVQVGSQAHADRYTYLPHIGLYLAATWAISDLSAPWRHRRQILATVAGVTLIVLAWRAWVQTSYWKNSESIWTRTLAVTSNNGIAHEYLGYMLLRKGQFDDAIYHLHESLKKNPKSARKSAGVNFILGNAFLEKRLMGEAMLHYQTGLKVRPQFADARDTFGGTAFHAGTLNNIARILSTCSDAEFRDGPRAIQLAEQANKLSDGKNPFFVRTLAAAYAETGRFNDAINAAQRALDLAIAQGDSALAGDLRMDIHLYRMKFPLRERSLTNIQRVP